MSGRSRPPPFGGRKKPANSNWRGGPAPRDLQPNAQRGPTDSRDENRAGTTVGQTGGRFSHDRGNRGYRKRAPRRPTDDDNREETSTAQAAGRLPCRGNRGSHQQQRGRGGDNKHPDADRVEGKGGHPKKMGRETYPMGFQKIKDLAFQVTSKPPTIQTVDLVQKLTSDGAFYARLAVMDQVESSGEDLLRYMLILVAEISQSGLSGVRPMVDDFLRKVADSKLIVKACGGNLMFMSDPDMFKMHRGLIQNLQSLIVILVELLSRMPSLAKELKPHLFLVRTLLDKEHIKQELNTDEMMTNYCKRLEYAWERRMKEDTANESSNIKKTRVHPADRCEEEAPPDSFRDLSVLPTKQEMLYGGKPYLRRNKQEGAYKDAETYLDVQFRLVREDYMFDIRNGIQGNKQDRDLRQYNGVRISPPRVNEKTGAMVCDIHFKASKRIRWEVSKRLIYGSLVCFSADNFKNDILFGVIHDRAPEKLAKGEVEVAFESFIDVRHDRDYIIVESQAYFEAYRHVLEGLQAIQPGKFPFEQYFVHCNSSIQPPAYLQRSQKRLDFTPLIKDEYFSNRKNYQRDVLNNIDWPTEEELGLDRSQLNALRVALTQELAIIQGPPGTGKTYIGWQLAKLLMFERNRSMWDTEYDQLNDVERHHPMLVVCYTNHALDQFLEGILSFMKTGIIRVGGRCQSEEMQPFLLRNASSNLSRSDRNDRRRVDYRLAMDRKRKCEETLNELGFILKSSGRQLLRFQVLEEFMSADIIKQLEGRSTETGNIDNSMYVWLTQESRTQRMDPSKMNLSLVVSLVYEHGVPEPIAKKALLETGNQNVWKALNHITFNYNNFRFWNEIPRQVMQWPTLDNIARLSDTMRVTQEVALYALETNNNSFRDAEWWIQQTFSQGINEDSESDAGWATPDEEAPVEIIDSETLAALHGDRSGPEYLFDDWLMEFSESGVYRSADDTKDKQRARLEQYWRDRNFQSLYVNNKRRKPSDEENEKWNELKQRILLANPMTEQQSGRVGDIWRLRLIERWQLFNYWTREFLRKIKGKLHEAETEFSSATKSVTAQRQMLDIEVLRSARVIGMTTTCAARYQATLQAIQPRIVIMEEAAEVLEAHLITSLSEGCQHCILIGDHQQLRPSASVYKLAKDYNLEISLFERLIKNKFPYAQLELQHRMRPEISRTLMPHFYQSLRDDKSVENYESVDGMVRDVFFLNHTAQEEDEGDSKSHKNTYEAKFLVALTKYLIQQTIPPENITILCGYSGQFFEVRNLVKTHIQERIRVCILDNYQGEESEIIILSLVRSNNEGKIGFLSVKNRVCVALSRAKRGFYCFGNFDHLTGVKTDHLVDPAPWKDIVGSLQQKGFYGNAFELECKIHGNRSLVDEPHKFKLMSPEGGCLEFCNVRLDCGHSCEKRCHVYDSEHKKYPCEKPCAKKCKADLHDCRKLCSQDCGNCTAQVKKELPCGHSKVVKCYQDVNTVSCQEPCLSTLSCGHPCIERCSQPHSNKCMVNLSKALPDCGHIITAPCYKDPQDINCSEKVRKRWPCGHINETNCSLDVKDNPCPLPCGVMLPDCEHLCKGSCGTCRSGRLHNRCEEKCQRILVCGHACQYDCSRVCPPCPKPCETACPHSICGLQSATGRKKKKGPKGRICGQFCPPCREPCGWECVHHKCEEKCNIPCQRPKCLEPCRKDILCQKRGKGEANTHVRKCIGVCGEECPNVCPDCEPALWAEITTVYFGLEDDEGTLFIQMEDCIKKCILPVESVDTWVKTEMEKPEITTIACPKCTTPIRKALRYGSELKKRLGSIQQIKFRIQGAEQDLEDARKQLHQKLEENQKQLVRRNCRELHATTLRLYPDGCLQCWGAHENTETGKLVSFFKTEVNKPQSNHLHREMIYVWSKLIDFMWDTANTEHEFLDNFLNKNKFKGFIPKDHLPRIYLHFRQDKHKPAPIIFATIFKKELEANTAWIKKHSRSASNFMLEQFSREVQRLDMLSDNFWLLLCLCETAPTFASRFKEEAEVGILDVLQQLKASGSDEQAAVREKIRVLRLKIKANSVVTVKEKLQIAKALAEGSHMRAFARGHWYQCPQGHLYVIGECGGANQISTCPECGARIGGEHHQLLAGNQEAMDMNNLTLQ